MIGRSARIPLAAAAKLHSLAVQYSDSPSSDVVQPVESVLGKGSLSGDIYAA